jgi:hypothetical protein
MKLFSLAFALMAVFYVTSFTFTKQPKSAALIEWQRYTLSAATSKKATFQWFKDNQLIPGATNNYLEIPEMVEGYAGKYYVQAKSGNRTIKSQTAELKYIKLITAQIEKDSVVLRSIFPGKIYFTLDGAEPSYNSFVYSSPIPISGTLRIRAMVNNIETDSMRITKRSLPSVYNE